MRKGYELLPHTADIAIRVKAKGLEGLFRNAALAMFDIIAGKPDTKKPSIAARYRIRQEAVNLDELFINWLNELLSLSAVKQKIFCGFDFSALDERRIEAAAAGCDTKDYTIHTEIKAATYHGLEIKKSRAGWSAKVIFDV